MTKFVLILVCFVHFQLIGQQHVEPDFIEIPTRTIKYEIDKTKRHVTIYGFYIDPIPESLGNYKIYISEIIDSALDIKRESIYPKVSVLLSNGLNAKEINFILDEYFIEEKYDDFPLIGLDIDQIEKYLKWKTDKIGFEILKQLNIKKIDSLSYADHYKIYKDSFGIPVQVDLLMPIEGHLVSAFEFIKANRDKINIDYENHSTQVQIRDPLLTRLNIKPVSSYNLLNQSTYELLNELVKTVQKDKTEYQSSLISIAGGKKSKYKLASERLILKPWRIWHVKLKANP